MKANWKLFMILIFICNAPISAQNIKDEEHRFDPPWDSIQLDGTAFTVYGIDNAPDFHGDINDPALVIFFAGNQYMVIPELLDTFRKKFPQYKRVFAETIPPGIEEKQIRSGNLLVGNMRISLQPDIITAGKMNMDQHENEGWFTQSVPYAKNKLAIMVAKGNPKGIKDLMDLGRPGVKISMPNPEWEGIAIQIIRAYEKAGGKDLRQTIMQDKFTNKMTYLTTIHHRQTPLRIMYGQSDAGTVWFSEAYYHSTLTDHPLDMVTLSDEINAEVTYVAGQMKNAIHPEAAKAFLEFLISSEGQRIYKKYGFSPVR